MAIRRIWIEDDCISCNLCQDFVPEVFEVRGGEKCRTAKNHRIHLVGDAQMEERIQEAADECPVEVIQLERD